MTLLEITTPVGFRTQVHTHTQPGIAHFVKGQIECVVSAEKTKVYFSHETVLRQLFKTYLINAKV